MKLKFSRLEYLRMFLTFVVLIFLCIMTNTLNAENQEDYLSKATHFHSEYEVDSAMYYYLQAESYLLESDNISSYLDALLGHAQLNVDLEAYDIANILLKRAEEINLSRNNNNNIITLRILETKGSILLYENQFDESLKYLNKYLELADSINYINPDLTASVYNNLGGNYYFLGDYEKTIILFEKALKLNKLTGNEEGIVTNLNNLGALYQAFGEYQKSILYINEALSIDIKNNVTENIAIFLNNIGNSYLKLGQYEKAEEYFSRALHIDIDSETKNQIAIDLNNIGWTHKQRGDFNKAIDHISRAANIFKETGNNLSYGKCLDNLGDLYRENKNYTLSKTSLLKANKIFKDNGQLKDEAVNLNNLGKLYFETDNPDKAIECHNSAIDINLKLNAIQGIASNYINLGNIFMSFKDFKSGLEYYHKAINVIIPGFNSTNILEIPKTESIPVEIELLSAVKAKAIAFQTIYSETTDDKDLIASFNNYSLAIDIIDKMRISYYSQDKYSLSKTEKSTYEKALKLAKQLYDNTGDKYYFERAWEISEKSKAAYLYELIRENEAKLYTNIPDTLLLREKIVKSQIFDLERELQEETAKKECDKILIDSLNEILFDKKFHILENIKTALEVNFPEYYQLKYNNIVCSVEKARAYAGKGTSIIEYYIGKESIFIFTINKDSLIFNEEVMDEKFISSVQELQNYLSNMFQSKERFNGFSQSSYYLYSILIDKISTTIKKDNLIIIPDGILGYIPFEVLFTKEINPDSIYYKDSPYLINDHAISYSYSVTLLTKPSPQKIKSPEKDLLAIAPSFSMSDDLPAFLTERGEEFIDLIGSKIEVTSINKIFKGEQYIDSIATESNFKKFASNYKILHIATHGLINDEDPMSSKLLFYRDNDSIQDGDLYTYELFNMQLNAELAVLSACNTGYGKLEEGEGIISLARGFLYAGVPSIVMTLWSVPDGTSAIIIEQFYKYLKMGYPKDLALQQAKLEYLKNADNLKANPYFWAGFVNIGNTDAFSKREPGNWYYWFIGSAVLILIMLSFRKLKKSIV